MNRKQRSQNKGDKESDKLHQLFKSNCIAQKSGDLQKAEAGWLTLIPQLEQINHPDTAKSLNNLALVYKHTGRYAEAEDYFQHSLALKEQTLGPDHPDTAQTLFNLAGVYQDTGRYVKAENFWQRSLAIREHVLGPSHPDTTKCLNNLAWVYETTGRYAEAENYYQRSLAIREQVLGPNHPDTARSLNNLAGVYEKTGRYAEAENIYQRSLAIREQVLGPNHPDTARSLNNLAIVYQDTGCYNEAEKYYQRSLANIEPVLGQNHSDTAAGLNNLACVYAATGRYVEAENFYQRSLAIREQVLGSNHPETARSLFNLAGVYEATGRFVEAENYLQRSLAIREQVLGPNHPETARSLNNLAGVYQNTERYNDAENYLKRSLAIMEQALGPNHPDTARIMNSLAGVYKATGRLNSAILLSKCSVNFFQKVRQNVSGMGKEALSSFDIIIASNYDDLGEILIKGGRYGEASFVMGMLKEKEQFELLRRDQQVDLPTRTISYNDSEAPLIVRFDEIGSSLSLLGKQVEALKQIKIRTSKQNKELAETKEHLKKMNREFSEFLDSLDKALPQREVSQINQDTYKLINMTDANANTVAIVTITAEKSFHSVMVTSHGRKAFSTDHKAVDIATKVLKFRELLKDPEDPTFLALSQELYDIIIRPIEEELIAGEYTTILWMLNGVLRLLPLAALHDGKQFLLEKLQNVCITTCSIIGPQSHEHWNGLGMGVTRELDGHSPLPSVKEELEGIISMDKYSGIIPGDILLDEAFTRESMESHLECGYKAVHIASHFELNPANETMSYLLLGDGGKIRMDELRSLPNLFKGVDMLAFSACSTGLGTASTRGREVDGIGYLGEMQGAKAVMATLWPVEDKSTSMLMREFYRLREEGMTKAEALQQAQLCLLKGKFKSKDDSHDFTHPYFWAPFILIGNGG